MMESFIFSYWIITYLIYFTGKTCNRYAWTKEFVIDFNYTDPIGSPSGFYEDQ